MHKWLQIYASVLTAALFVIVLTGSKELPSETGVPAETVVAKGVLPQIVRGVDLDRTYSLAGEVIPMDNLDARERLDRELSVNAYWHSSTLLHLKSGPRFFSVMEPILAEYGVPDDFKYLAVAESSLRNVTSPAGAKGVWQFMQAGAKSYGLEVNGEVDERYHLEKATRAASKYLKDLHERFGSWLLAAAAYNMGPTRLARLLEEQRAGSYFDLNINEETSRYVFRIVAIKEIFERPEDFGFQLDEEDYYPPLNDYGIVRVNKPVANWGEFAERYGTSYRMLKVYNPWLIDSRLSASGNKTYEIKIPKQ